MILKVARKILTKTRYEAYRRLKFLLLAVASKAKQKSHSKPAKRRRRRGFYKDTQKTSRRKNFKAKCREMILKVVQKILIKTRYEACRRLKFSSALLHALRSQLLGKQLRAKRSKDSMSS